MSICAATGWAATFYSSCSNALFNFTESIRHFNKCGSEVYGAFLDASFDKVLLNGLQKYPSLGYFGLEDRAFRQSYYKVD